MHLFLTSVLPFLAHDHASAAAFLTCRSKNFHASIIPEFLSDEEKVKFFCEARQQNQLEALVDKSVDRDKQYKHLYNLFAETPLLQFSPSLVLHDESYVNLILKPLLETKYFTRSLQRCSVECAVSDDLLVDLLHGLSRVQSLTKLALEGLDSEHLQIVINAFPGLESLHTNGSSILTDDGKAIKFISPPPRVTKTLRSLKMHYVDSLSFIQFIPNFPNIRKLELRAGDSRKSRELNLLPLSSSLPLLTDLSFDRFNFDNIDSLKNFVHLSTLQFLWCGMSDFSFLSNDGSLPHLTTLRIDGCDGFSTLRFSSYTLPSSSFASLTHAMKLHVLEIIRSEFDCLQHLENMVHLRKLNLSRSNIDCDSRSLQTLIRNSFQLEELNLDSCYKIGNQGAIAGALYSSHSRLRVLNLEGCGLVDDDLNGIGALKNTLEVLNLGRSEKLTNTSLVHCKDLIKLKRLNLSGCIGITDLSPLKDCLNLEELTVSCCRGLIDDSFKVFSEVPNSFANLRVLDISSCSQLTEKVFVHLLKNNHLLYQLKELNVGGSKSLLSLSAQKKIYKFKGLRKFQGIAQLYWSMRRPVIELKRKMVPHMKNIELIK